MRLNIIYIMRRYGGCIYNLLIARYLYKKTVNNDGYEKLYHWYRGGRSNKSTELVDKSPTTDRT